MLFRGSRQLCGIFLLTFFLAFASPGVKAWAITVSPERCHYLFSFRDLKWENTLTFGPEFTFTDKRMSYFEPLSAKGKTPEDLPYRTRKHEEIRKLLEERCARRGDCRLALGSDKHGGNFRVTYSDDWYFEVGVDNGVLEAQTKPGTLNEFRALEERIQEDLFDAMAKVGLKPSDDAGGGHIHVGALPFREDPVLFRNFFVDYANHPDIGVVLSDRDFSNAPPLASLGESQRAGLIKGLEVFDKIEKPLLKDFIWQIHSEVYMEPGPVTRQQSWGTQSGAGSYYQAIRLARMSWPENLATFELRAFAAQKSMQEYLLQIELLTARIRYLSEKGERVPFTQFSWKEGGARDVVDQFYSYVTETGLPWERYRVLLPFKYRLLEPRKKN